MVRQLVRLDANSNPSQSINLPFDAEVLSVINPTAQSIGISQGGNISPSAIANADIWIPADSGINYPVVGRNFAAAMMPPLLVNAPSGIPTAANLFFTAQEPVPNFGAFPLSTLATQALQDVVLIPKTDTSALTTFSQTVAVTPDIQSITIGLVNDPSVGPNLVTTDTQVVGVQSGYVYWHLPSNPNAVQIFNNNFPFFGGADTDITLTVNYAAARAGNAVQLIGHRYGIGPSTALSGSLTVVPSPAVYPWPVTINSPETLAANPSWLHSPEYSAIGIVGSPGSNATIAATTITVSGVYRIEYEMGTSDTEATGRYMQAFQAGQVVGIQPAPGARTLVIPAIFAGQPTGLSVGTGVLGASAGAFCFAYIRAYRIS